MNKQLIYLLKKDISDASIGESNNYNIEDLKKLLNAIEKTNEFDDEIFKILFDYLMTKSDFTDDEKKKILLNIGFSFWRSNDTKEEEIEVIVENDTLITDETLINLLKKFNYTDEFIKDFLSSNKIDNLKEYGNTQNIIDILIILKDLEIESNDLLGLNNRIEQLITIMVNSNKTLINEIIKIIETDLEKRGISKNTQTMKERFIDFLGHESLFGVGKRAFVHHKRREKKKDPKKKKDKTFSGTHNKFKENFYFLLEQNIDLGEDYLTCLEKNPEALKRNFWLLKSFGLENENIAKCLSVLNVVDLEKLIDLVIELGVAYTFKNSLSHFLHLNRLVRYRIKYCKLHNISIAGRGDNGQLAKKIYENKPFSEEKGGPEVDYGLPSDEQVYFDKNDHNSIIENYCRVMDLIDIDTYDGIEENDKVDCSIFDYQDFEYSYHKAYSLSLIKKFDEKYKVDKFRYSFKGNGKEVIIARNKVLKTLTKVLKLFLDEKKIDNYTDYQYRYFVFDNLSNILLHAIKKDSLLTKVEDEIIKNNIFFFVYSLNNEILSIRNNELVRESYNNSLLDYKRRR